jgi:hypothetical protein
MPTNEHPVTEMDRLCQQLERFALDHSQGRPVNGRAAIAGVLIAVTSSEVQADLGLPSDVTAADAIAALRLIPGEHAALEASERQLIEAARDRSETWESLGAALGKRSGQAMQQRYRRIGGRRTWPTRANATTNRGAAGAAAD